MLVAFYLFFKSPLNISYYINKSFARSALCIHELLPHCLMLSNVSFFYMSMNFNEIHGNLLYLRTYSLAFCPVCQTVSAVAKADLQAANKRCDYVILTSLENQINKIKLSKPSWSGKQYFARKARYC